MTHLYQSSVGHLVIHQATELSYEKYVRPHQKHHGITREDRSSLVLSQKLTADAPTRPTRPTSDLSPTEKRSKDLFGMKSLGIQGSEHIKRRTARCVLFKRNMATLIKRPLRKWISSQKPGPPRRPRGDVPHRRSWVCCIRRLKRRKSDRLREQSASPWPYTTSEGVRGRGGGGVFVRTAFWLQPGVVGSGGVPIMIGFRVQRQQVSRAVSTMDMRFRKQHQDAARTSSDSSCKNTQDFVHQL